MSSLSPEELRLRLVEIADELRALPSGAFARKHELNTQADEYRNALAELLQPDLDAVSDEWAVRAGRKGSHSVNDDEKLAQAAIVSPGDGGR